MRAKWPSDARTLGHPCSTDVKRFASPPFVWTGLANLRFGDRTTEPEIKRCGPTRVRALCINALVTCDPRQNKSGLEYVTYEISNRALGYALMPLQMRACVRVRACVLVCIQTSAADKYHTYATISAREPKPSIHCLYKQSIFGNILPFLDT